MRYVLQDGKAQNETQGRLCSSIYECPCYSKVASPLLYTYGDRFGHRLAQAPAAIIFPV